MQRVRGKAAQVVASPEACGASLQEVNTCRVFSTLFPCLVSLCRPALSSCRETPSACDVTSALVAREPRIRRQSEGDPMQRSRSEACRRAVNFLSRRLRRRHEAFAEDVEDCAIDRWSGASSRRSFQFRSRTSAGGDCLHAPRGGRQSFPNRWTSRCPPMRRAPINELSNNRGGGRRVAGRRRRQSAAQPRGATSAKAVTASPNCYYSCYRRLSKRTPHRYSSVGPTEEDVGMNVGLERRDCGCRSLDRSP